MRGASVRVRQGDGHGGREIARVLSKARRYFMACSSKRRVVAMTPPQLYPGFSQVGDGAGDRTPAAALARARDGASPTRGGRLCLSRHARGGGFKLNVVSLCFGRMCESSHPVFSQPSLFERLSRRLREIPSREADRDAATFDTNVSRRDPEQARSARYATTGGAVALSNISATGTRVRRGPLSMSAAPGRSALHLVDIFVDGLRTTLTIDDVS